MKTYTAIGKRVTRTDATAKVTGEAKYVDDLPVLGMVYGKVLRSHLPHAKTLNIDIGIAEKPLAARAVVTWEEYPGHKVVPAARQPGQAGHCSR